MADNPISGLNANSASHGTKTGNSIQNEITLQPLGIIRCPRTEPIDDNWGNIVSRIELDPSLLTEESVIGLAAFSHLEVAFLLHHVAPEDVETCARHPRNRADFPLVGILGQRAKRRPNRIGISRCQLLSVDGLQLSVQGLDAIDTTPVLDVKPYFREFAPRGEVRQPEWVSELMKDYY